MKDPNKKNREIKEGEDEISATSTDANTTEKPADDGFKKPESSKHRTGWETPHDEQMFDKTTPAGN